MAISTKRFTFLDEETNVAIADFYNEGNTDILNSPINELKTIDSDMEEFLSNAVQSAKENIPSTDWEIIPSDTRISKDSFSNLANLDNFSSKDITSMISGLLPGNPLAQASFSKLSSNCKNRAGSRRGSGRPYGQSNNCNGNRRSASNSCDSNQFGSAISQATGGNFNFGFLDLDSMLGNITGLSAMGYDMNMCGVFGSLSQGIPYTDMLSKASGSLLGGLTSSGNVLGMLDLASSSGNLKTKLFNPSAISSMLSSFNFPKEIKQNGNSSLTNRFTGAMEIFDTNWNKSSHDNILTTHGVRNSDARSLMQQRALDNIYNQDNLDVAPSDDFSFYSAAF